MTTPRYEIHETDCPRLCEFWGTIAACKHARRGGGSSHACTCTGSRRVAVEKKKLDALVEVAMWILSRRPDLSRLRDTLRPFRAEPDERR